MAEKKKFFPVSIPMLNEAMPVLSLDKESIVNKRIKIDMTRKLRGKNLEVKFIISKTGEELTAAPYEISLLPYFIRRMFRKSISYVEDSFITGTKDRAVRIKPFLITRKKVSRSIRNALQKETKSLLTETLANKSCEEVFSDIIDGKLQKDLNLKLKKIYPLSLCEIRNISIEKSSLFSPEKKDSPIAKEAPSEEKTEIKEETIQEKKTEEKSASEKEEEPVKEKKAKRPAKEKKTDKPKEEEGKE